MIEHSKVHYGGVDDAPVYCVAPAGVQVVPVRFGVRSGRRAQIWPGHRILLAVAVLTVDGN